MTLFSHDMSVRALAVNIFSYPMIGMQLPIASVFLYVTFFNYLMNKSGYYIDNSCMCVFNNCKAMLNFPSLILRGGSCQNH